MKNLDHWELLALIHGFWEQKVTSTIWKTSHQVHQELQTSCFLKLVQLLSDTLSEGPSPIYFLQQSPLQLFLG